MKYEIYLHKQAIKDKDKIAKISALKKNVDKLIKVLQNNPYEPPYEKLIDTMQKVYSRRINKQHRLVYTIDEAEKEVFILRMWTHYE